MVQLFRSQRNPSNEGILVLRWKFRVRICKAFQLAIQNVSRANSIPGVPLFGRTGQDYQAGVARREPSARMWVN